MLQHEDTGDQAKSAEESQAESAKTEWLSRVSDTPFNILFSHKLMSPIS